jgi:hypothetical protein
MEKEQAKVLAETLGKVVSAAVQIDKNKNGKIETMEIFELVQVLGMEIFKVYGDFKEGINQIANADSQDFRYLVDAFASKFDLENDDAENLIEKIAYLIADAIELVDEAKEILKK